MTATDLINFETEIADLFNTAKIRAPVHLYYGNEERMIEIFRDVRPEDWVCCSWRSHYQCLLKGVPPAEVRAESAENEGKECLAEVAVDAGEEFFA